MMGGYGLMGDMGWLGMLTMVLFWVGVLALIIWGVSNLSAPRQASVAPDAREMLKQRYARGEINREEFEQARAVLH